MSNVAIIKSGEVINSCITISVFIKRIITNY